MNAQWSSPNTVYAICRLEFIPTRRAIGFHLMIVDEDGSRRP